MGEGRLLKGKSWGCFRMKGVRALRVPKPQVSMAEGRQPPSCAEEAGEWDEGLFWGQPAWSPVTLHPPLAPCALPVLETGLPDAITMPCLRYSRPDLFPAS